MHVHLYEEYFFLLTGSYTYVHVISQNVNNISHLIEILLNFSQKPNLAIIYRNICHCICLTKHCIKKSVQILKNIMTIPSNTCQNKKAMFILFTNSSVEEYVEIFGTFACRENTSRPVASSSY